MSLKTVNLTNLKRERATGTRRELDTRVRIPVEVSNEGDGLYFDIPIEVHQKRGEQQCLSKRGDKKTNEFKLQREFTSNYSEFDPASLFQTWIHSQQSWTCEFPLPGLSRFSVRAPMVAVRAPRNGCLNHFPLPGSSGVVTQMEDPQHQIS